MKKIKNLFIVLSVMMIIVPFCVKAETEKPEVNKEPVKIYVFRSDTCPHCINTMNFLNEIEDEYGDYFDVVDYEVSNQANAQLYSEVAEFMGDSAGGVPYIVLGKYTYPQGFEPDSQATADQTMGEQLIERILEVYESDDRYDVMVEMNNKPDYSTVVGVVALVVIAGLVVMAVISRRQSK